ncbi:hypothetical protein [Microcoleus sp. CAWBG58]|uniref:hypothetical protein n=1 Tax=Microcoleus sp. CAWBG58 TaxID=2841651 RepID=UPI0025FB5627|nr:hypothetical protein [Microcoleus sp. CAWBG58]
MKPKTSQAPIATKIKKWVQTAKEAEKTRLAISITRLTSIKSLCTEQVAAEKFALYIAKRVQQDMNQTTCPEHYPEEEWEVHKQVIAEGIAQMEFYLENPSNEGEQSIRKLLRTINGLQGDDRRNVAWGTVHFVRSGNLLKLDYALRCFTDNDFPYWIYKLAREYVERYSPQYSSGIIPESVPMLLEVAEFWCQYYFSQSLSEKFPGFV